ncbi:MAG TPA: mycothiol conjugate amidase Mca [Acidimicrobiales bacterium]|nr:mycothiol conjugate amidase Mca [Acidimicrobiales bacterium]
MSDLCLLTVHAHPDDEASKGAGSVARYHAEGAHTVLVTCTGGEAGDILNPAMDRPGVRERLHEVRRAELDAAATIIGYDEVVLLGYRDSGMPDTPENADSRSFARAPLDEAVGRLVAVIRRTRPQVMVTYPEDQSGYPHPDHIRSHEVATAAFSAAADPHLYPDAGPAWEPKKLYWVTWSARRIQRTHEAYVNLGLESPFDDERLARVAAALAEATATTVVDISGYTAVQADALRAHATQVDPTSRHWFGLPPGVAETVWPYDEYLLAEDRTGRVAPGPGGEDDLFAGVRELVRR